MPASKISYCRFLYCISDDLIIMVFVEEEIIKSLDIVHSSGNLAICICPMPISRSDGVVIKAHICQVITAWGLNSNSQNLCRLWMSECLLSRIRIKYKISKNEHSSRSSDFSQKISKSLPKSYRSDSESPLRISKNISESWLGRLGKPQQQNWSARRVWLPSQRIENKL